MKYGEILEFLKNKNIRAIQFIIAEEVNNQLAINVDENEFEIICKKVYEEYLYYVGSPDLCEIVDEILTLRNHKER